MDVGRDRADGGRPDGEGNGGEEAGDIDLRAALEDVTFGSEDGEGSADADSTGGSDVDAVFEDFDESSPEEIIDSAEERDDEGVEEATDEDVANLFGDLGAVELDPDGDSTDAGSESPGGSSASAGGAASDTPTETSELPDEDEMANEVEGLLDDLGSVEVEAGADAGATASGNATAETRPTVLDTEEASAFQWLGEDVNIFSPGAGEADRMFEEFEESTPEELIASVDAERTVSTPDVGATDLFTALARGERPAAAVEDPPVAGTTWTAGPEPDTGETRASDVFADLPGDPPGVSSTNGTSETADDDLAFEFDDDLDSAADAAEQHLDLELDDPTEETDAEEDADATAPPSDDGGSPTVDAASTAGTDAEAKSGADEPSTGTAIETDLGEVGVEASGSVVGESDVDAVFERFEESTPEEVIAAGEEPPTADERPDGDASESVEELLGDLGTVDLEREEPVDADRTEAPPAPGSEATESEVEGLLDDLSSVDLEAGEPAATDTTTQASPEPRSEDDPDELERTGEDTHVAVGESDVDAVFERFEESTPEEIAATGGIDETGSPTGAVDEDPFSTTGESEATPFEAEATGDQDADATDDDEPAAEADDDSDGGILATIKSILGGVFG